MTSRNGSIHASSPSARLLNVEEVALYLGVGARMVRRLIAERRIPFHHIGRHVRIAEADVRAFIEAGRINAAR